MLGLQTPQLEHEQDQGQAAGPGSPALSGCVFASVQDSGRRPGERAPRGRGGGARVPDRSQEAADCPQDSARVGGGAVNAGGVQPFHAACPWVQAPSARRAGVVESRAWEGTAWCQRQSVVASSRVRVCLSVRKITVPCWDTCWDTVWDTWWDTCWDTGWEPAGTPARTPAGILARTSAGIPGGTPAGTPDGIPGRTPAGTPAGIPAGTPAEIFAGIPGCWFSAPITDVPRPSIP